MTLASRARTFYGAPMVPAAFTPRPRVHAFFDTLSPVVVLRGGAGSGKTVAVAQWASGCAEPGAWIDVDESISARCAFWAAAARRMSDARLAVFDLDVLDELAGKNLAIAMRREIERSLLRVERPIRLVVDSAHLFEDTEGIVCDVLALAATTSLRFVLLTRAPSAIEAERVLLAGSASLHTADEFAFDAEEIAALLADAPGGARAEAIIAATEGHPTLVGAAAHALGALGGRASGRVLGETVARAVSRALRTDFLGPHGIISDAEFALRIAVQNPVTAELAEELTGRRDAMTLLEYDVQNGLGFWSDERHEEFAFTPLVLEALRTEAEARIPDELDRLRGIALDWAERTGRELSAFDHAVRRGELHRAARIATRSWHLLLRNEGEAVETVLASVETSRLAEHPALCLMLAVLYTPHPAHRLRSAELLALAARRGPQGGPVDAVQHALNAVMETMAARMLGRDEHALDAAVRADEAVRALTLAQRMDLGGTLPAAWNQIAISYFAVGRTDLALTAAAAAYAVPRARAGREWLHALALLAGVHAARGELTTARGYVEVVRRDREPGRWRDGYIGVFYRVAEAYLALEDADLDRARRQLRALGSRSARIEHWHLTANVEAIIALASGQAPEAAVKLGELLKPGVRPATTAGACARVRIYCSLLNLAAGHVAEARAVLAEASPALPAVLVANAFLHLATGAPDRALALLAGFDERGGSGVRLRVDAQLVLADALYRLGKEREALEQLEAAIVVMKHNALSFPLALLPSGGGIGLLDWARQLSPAVRAELEELDPFDPLIAIVRDPLDALTQRERVVLEHLATTSSRAQIAERLYVSENTVKTQLRGIYRKLGVWSRDEAVRVAGERGLLN